MEDFFDAEAVFSWNRNLPNNSSEPPCCHHHDVCSSLEDSFSNAHNHDGYSTTFQAQGLVCNF